MKSPSSPETSLENLAVYVQQNNILYLKMNSPLYFIPNKYFKIKVALGKHLNIKPN